MQHSGTSFNNERAPSSPACPPGVQNAFQPWVNPTAADCYDIWRVLEAQPDYLRAMVSAASADIGTDPGMTLSTLVSAMAAAIHGQRVVERPDGGIEPMAIFSVILAGPATGKTRLHKLAHSRHDAEDAHRYVAYGQARCMARSRRAKAPEDGGDEAAATITRPRLRPVLLQDVSNRGLLEAVEGVGEATSISVHEGQKVLGSALFRQHLDTLNVLYDAESRTTLTRGKGDVVQSFDATLNVLVMVQPDVFGLYLQTHGEHARAIGFLGRCLFTSIPPIRPLPNALLGVDDGCLEVYAANVQSFLNARLAKLETGNTEREVVKFSDGARDLWRQLVNEHEQLTRARYSHVQDAASRAMQNVVRIAGILHSYGGLSGDIPPETLNAAWVMVQWHMTEFAKLFPPSPIAPLVRVKPTAREKQLQREVDDARAILDCVAQLCGQLQEPAVLKSKVFIRSGLYHARFRTALMRLVDEGHVLESGEGKQTRVSIAPQSTVFQTITPIWLGGNTAGV
jgi:hypothetical protein